MSSDDAVASAIAATAALKAATSMFGSQDFGSGTSDLARNGGEMDMVAGDRELERLERLAKEHARREKDSRCGLREEKEGDDEELWEGDEGKDAPFSTTLSRSPPFLSTSSSGSSSAGNEQPAIPPLTRREGGDYSNGRREEGDGDGDGEPGGEPGGESSPPPPPAAGASAEEEPRVFVAPRALALGDILLVQGVSLVSVSQFVSRLFSGPHARLGSSSSVHAMIVVGTAARYAEVVHLTRDGMSFGYIEAPVQKKERSASSASTSSLSFFARRGSRAEPVAKAESEEEAAERARDQHHAAVAVKSVDAEDDDDDEDEEEEEDEVFEARVFRLRNADHRTVALNAATEALRMLDSRKVQFSPLAGIQSAFKDARVGQVGGAWDVSDLELKEPKSMFCSEMVVRAYQRSMVRNKVHEKPFFHRVMDLDACAVSPMLLEGFLVSSNEDWQAVGFTKYFFS